MTASAVDNDIDGNGTLDLAYEDLNESGFVDERDMAIVMAAATHPGINFPYQTADQAKLKTDLEKLAADIKSGKIKITDNADGTVTLDVSTAPPQPPVNGPTSARENIIDVNKEKAEAERRAAQSALEAAEATELANAARERLRRAQEGDQPSWFSRTFMGGGTEGEEVLGSAWSGTKSFLGRAWEATSGTFNHMKGNVGGQNIIGAVAGVGTAIAALWGADKISWLKPILGIPVIGPLLKLASAALIGGFIWTQAHNLMNGRKTAFGDAVDATASVIQGHMVHTPTDLKEFLTTSNTSQNAALAGWAMNHQGHIGQNAQRVLLFRDVNDQIVFDEMAAFRAANGEFVMQLRADNGETFMAREVISGTIPQGSGRFVPINLNGIGLPANTKFEAVRHAADGTVQIGGTSVQEPVVFKIDGRTFVAEVQGFDPNVLGAEARNAPPAPAAPSPGGG